jgi:hypothetical protein
MFRLIDDKTTGCSRSVTRRDFLQDGTAGVLGVLTAGSGDLTAAGREEAGPKGPLKAMEKAGVKHLLWQPTANLTLRFLPPAFEAAVAKKGQGPLPLKVHLAASQIQEDGVEFTYELTIEEGGARRMGKYAVIYSLGAQKDERVVLIQKTTLHFDEQLRLNLSVAHTVQVTGQKAVTCTLPLHYGVVKDLALGKCQEVAGYFVLGRGSTSSEGEELALPVIGMGSDAEGGETLTVATDPYCGSQFRAWRSSDKAPDESSVTTSYTYLGSLVPVREEERTQVFVAHRGGVDGMLRSFYEAIPEIQPSPSWVHDIQLNYYDDLSDYKSEVAQGWYKDVEKLAGKIPAEHRGKAVLCLECYYDYVGRYNYDHAKRQLDKEWNAYDFKAHSVPMTLAEVHKRIKFAKDLGFRVVWYFGDGMAFDATSPFYRKDWVIKDEAGQYPAHGFWQWRPGIEAQMPPGHTHNLHDGGGPINYLLDPGNPEVCAWLMGYMEALLKEYGRELDGFVWDETFLVESGWVSMAGAEPTYSDRACMRLTSRLSQLVQEWRKINPDLVFLASDMGRTPYALVAHGTYQDSACFPQIWPPCFLINYRTCLWSCNWSPVTGDTNNHLAVKMYGLPQGVSNGYRDDQGPSEMPEELLDKVIQRFLKRIKEGGGRTRYLLNVMEAMDLNSVGVRKFL